MPTKNSVLKPLPAELQHPAFLHGFSLFTTVRTRQGQALLWPQHLQRLQKSAAWLGWSCPDISPPKLENWPWGLLRITLTEDNIFYSHKPLPSSSKPVQGVQIQVTDIQVHPQLAAHKTGNYLPYRLTKMQAKQAFEALLLDSSEHIADGSRTAPLFKISDEWVVPSGGLPSITRAAFLESQTYTKRPVHLNELPQIQKAWLCGSGVGIVPVREILWGEEKFSLEVTWPEGDEPWQCWI